MGAFLPEGVEVVEVFLEDLLLALQKRHKGKGSPAGKAHQQRQHHGQSRKMKEEEQVAKVGKAFGVQKGTWE